MSSADFPDGDDDRGSHVAKQQRQQFRDYQRRSVKEWSDLAHAAVARQDWTTIHAILDERLVPLADLSPRALRHGKRESTRSEFGFDLAALRRYLRSRDGSAHVHATPGVDGEETTLEDVEIEANGVPVGPRDLVAAFRSVYTLLAIGERVNTQARSEVPAYEYEHQVGVRYYSPLSAGNRAAELIDGSGSLKATLFTGGQGSGKSTAVETVVEDRIERGHKVIDLMDFVKAENVMYDVPPRDKSMQMRRAEMGLDVGFQAYDPPKLASRVPLTPELAKMDVPFDTERDDFVVKPFTIAASDLSYRQLVMILPHITRVQENHLRAAHQTLDQRGGDWTLADCAEAVREETNAGDTVADRIERSLETAQHKTFIQDEQVDDEYQLDWDDIMRDTDTVTTFTMFSLPEKSDRLLLASYLLDRLYDARRELLRNYTLHEYPPLTTVMRELHQIVPRSKSEQDAEKTIEGYMTDSMSELIALVRHADMELLCDTQKFKQQLSPDVSGLFHRIFAFSGQKPDIKKVFNTRVDDSSPAETVAQFDVGKCAMVSGDGYTMPIQMAPPRCHHLDAETDGNGLGFRVRHPSLPEEWREAPWDATVPARLRFDDVPDSPIATFWRECVRDTGDGDDFILKDDFTSAYSKWADANNEPPKGHKKLHSWVKGNFEVEDGETTKHDVEDVRSKTCYWGIELTI